MVAKEVLRQMREEGKSYSNDLEDSVSSYSKTYSFDKRKKSYNCHVWDKVIGGSADIAMTESEMLDFIARQTLSGLRESKI